MGHVTNQPLCFACLLLPLEFLPFRNSGEDYVRSSSLRLGFEESIQKKGPK